jgi:hypothetical protein
LPQLLLGRAGLGQAANGLAGQAQLHIVHQRPGERGVAGGVVHAHGLVVARVHQRLPHLGQHLVPGLQEAEPAGVQGAVDAVLFPQGMHKIQGRRGRRRSRPEESPAAGCPRRRNR